MSDVLAEFGYRVRDARTRKRWTLEQLAREALLNPDRKGYVSQIENGRIRITALTVGKLAHVLDLPTSVTEPMLRQPLPPEDEVTETDRVAEQLLAADPSDPAPQVSESLLIALAYQYAHGSHRDLQTAYLGLQAALQTAAGMRRRAELPQNTGDQVDAVLQRLAALNDTGNFDAGAAEVDAALQHWDEEQAERIARKMALLDIGVEQDRLRNSPASAAVRLVAKLRLEAHAGGLFSAMRALSREWYERGRDRGLNFESEVAVHLAQHTLKQAKGAAQRGMAHEDLGSALWTLGEREVGTTHLKQAIGAHRAALLDIARKRDPLNWARVQNNLGNAFGELGERETGTARLEQAVDAYRDALKEWTRDRAPQEWAIAKNNLGTALSDLGEREAGTARLEQAVATFHEALQERTRAQVPLDWAMTQNNLGFALAVIGQREAGTDRLQQAALAYHNVLQELTRDSLPFDWAKTQWNLAHLDLAYFDKAADPARLASAKAHATAASEVFEASRATYQLARTDDLLAQIAARSQG